MPGAATTRCRWPNIPGHEFAGAVAAVGSGVTRFNVGDRVTAPFVNGCGRCTWCRSGQAQVCPDQSQPGFTHPGSFAELVAVRAADFNLVRLPDAVDFVTAAGLGCRFATAYHALTAQSRLASGDWLVVFGCGGVGLSAVLLGASAGARVIAIDPSEAARRWASELGAEVTLDRADPAALQALTGGGAHVTMDALGSGAIVDVAVRSLRPRGRHVQVGLMLGDQSTAAVPWGAVVARELQVVGSHGMPAADYPAMLELIGTGRVDPGRLVGRVVDLSRAGVELMAMDAPALSPGITVATL
ncbi:MAG: zinc-binding dehydrogenase [Micropruina sp.]|uniref:zinc-binding dehydrogenase n=1 Tax=Micropruina sp. TaxID=2737536 RepID=UPI0039E659B4